MLLFCQLSSSFLNSLAFEFPGFCIRICFFLYFSFSSFLFPLFLCLPWVQLREKLHLNLPNMSHFVKHCRQIEAFLLRSISQKTCWLFEAGSLGALALKASLLKWNLNSGMHSRTFYTSSSINITFVKFWGKKSNMYDILCLIRIWLMVDWGAFKSSFCKWDSTIFGPVLPIEVYCKCSTTFRPRLSTALVYNFIRTSREQLRVFLIFLNLITKML